MIITVTVFGSIRLLSCSANLQLNFAGRILEAIRGAHRDRDALLVGPHLDPHLGGFKSEKARFALAPGNLHGEEPGGQLRRAGSQRPLNAGRVEPRRFAAERIMTTGMISSCGDNPPWKYALPPPFDLKTAKVHGVAISKSLSTPSEVSEVRRYEGSDVPPTPTQTRRCRSRSCHPGRRSSCLRRFPRRRDGRGRPPG